MKKVTQYVAKSADADGRIAYSDQDDAVWRDLVHQQTHAVQAHCAAPYLDGHRLLNLPTDRVPQCVDVTTKLLPLTGWTVAPVPALIGFSTFFGMLAERTFPAASFIRSREDFDYIEEPDIFHEIYGHTPLLTHPLIAKFSEAIGQAGKRCNKADYAWLIRLYWFTVEFGLIKENGTIKALGSGLASSPTELIHAMTPGAAIQKPFDVIDVLRTPYRIDIPQPIYFVLDSLDQLISVTERDLVADIQTARTLGLHTPAYPPKEKAHA